MPHSMTSFARTNASGPWGHLQCEIKSVNHRYLELTFKLPEPLRPMEPTLREALRAELGRGKVEVVMGYQPADDQDLGKVDTEVVAALKARIGALGAAGIAAGSINPLELLAWPGVLSRTAVDTEARDDAAHGLFKRALQDHVTGRYREGVRLGQLIAQRCQAVSATVAQLRQRVPALIAHQQQRIEQRIRELNADIDQDRLAQEWVYIAQRADVAEELDRLETHIGEVERVLTLKEPIGRRLDFLMQELNREANTVGSKSPAGEITTATVELKVLIEQMREQVQNIE